MAKIIPPPASDYPGPMDEFDEILGLCYNGPLEDVPWHDFLERLSERLNAVFTFFILRPPETDYDGLLIYGGNNVATENIASYNQTYHALDPFVDLPANTVITVSEMVGFEEWKNCVYYKQYLEHTGVLHILGVDLYTPDGIHCRLRACRMTGSEDFNDEDKAVVAALLPHLQRAVIIHSRLNTMEAELRLYQGTMDRMYIGTIIVDENGRLLRINTAAEEIIGEGDGLMLSSGALKAEYNEETRDLIQAVKQAVNRTPEDTPGLVKALAITRPSGKAKLGLLIRSVPLTEWSDGTRCPAAVVFIRDPERHTFNSYQDIMRELFDLTPAEASLAMLLANGLTLDEAAEEMGIRRNTARAHLRMIFSKTEVTRQTELVRVLLNSVLPLL